MAYRRPLPARTAPIPAPIMSLRRLGRLPLGKMAMPFAGRTSAMATTARNSGPALPTGNRRADRRLGRPPGRGWPRRRGDPSAPRGQEIAPGGDPHDRGRDRDRDRDRQRPAGRREVPAQREKVVSPASFEPDERPPSPRGKVLQLSSETLWNGFARFSSGRSLTAPGRRSCARRTAWTCRRRRATTRASQLLVAARARPRSERSPCNEQEEKGAGPERRPRRRRTMVLPRNTMFTILDSVFHFMCGTF
jgi:hypothetical protein